MSCDTPALVFAAKVWNIGSETMSKLAARSLGCRGAYGERATERILGA